MSTKLISGRVLVWHKRKHDDFVVSEVLLRKDETAEMWADNAHRDGHFTVESRDGGYDTELIPWHSVSFIQYEHLD